MDEVARNEGARTGSPSIGLRLFVLVFGGLLLAAATAPLFRPLGEDSFPFSTYPMFSAELPRIVSVTHAVGVDAEGRRTPLDPLVASGNREVLQTQAILERAVGSGRALAQCEEIVRRVLDDSDLASVRTVEIATDTYDVVAYFEADSREPLERRLHMRCEVPR
ncbi:MAG: hypothetical protein U0230_01005 [Polyangiales bacterium]